ncbi:MAG TPA: hypothetical protein VEI97_21045, partial [bacterium]|nr:hypothetical protein [bacterium]
MRPHGPALLVVVTGTLLAGCTGSSPDTPAVTHRGQTDCPTLIGVVSSDDPAVPCHFYSFNAIFDSDPKGFGGAEVIWDFGGGATLVESAGTGALVSLGAPGAYSGTASAESPCGTTSVSFEYRVYDPGLSAVVEGAAASLTGRLMADASGSTGAGGTIEEYRWVFNYGGDPAEFETPDLVTNSPHLSAAHTYESPGVYELGLQIALGCTTAEASCEVEVRDLRDPFTGWAFTRTVASGVTGLVYGADNQDWADSVIKTQVGGDNFLALGDHLYTTFYGTAGSGPGLYLVKSIDGGNSWSAPLKLATPLKYAGASIAGATDSTGADVVYVALGTNLGGAQGQQAGIQVFTNPNAASSNSWTPTAVGLYTIVSGGDNAAASPALAVNPSDPNEVHLAFGTQGWDIGGLTKKFQIRSSTSGAAGLASDTPDLVDATSPGGPDAWWLAGGGSIHSLDLAQHGRTGEIYLLVGMNQHTYVLRSSDHG